MTHPHLAELPQDVARREMAESKSTLEERLGDDVRWLCYPFGSFTPETEELARTVAGPSRGQRARVEPDATVAPIADALRDRLKTRVRIRGRAARGRIEIEYHGAEDLDRIARLLLGG